MGIGTVEAQEEATYLLRRFEEKYTRRDYWRCKPHEVEMLCQHWVLTSMGITREGKEEQETWGPWHWDRAQCWHHDMTIQDGVNGGGGGCAWDAHSESACRRATRNIRPAEPTHVVDSRARRRCPEFKHATNSGVAAHGGNA